MKSSIKHHLIVDGNIVYSFIHEAGKNLWHESVTSGECVRYFHLQSHKTAQSWSIVRKTIAGDTICIPRLSAESRFVRPRKCPV